MASLLRWLLSLTAVQEHTFNAVWAHAQALNGNRLRCVNERRRRVSPGNARRLHGKRLRETMENQVDQFALFPIQTVAPVNFPLEPFGIIVEGSQGRSILNVYG